MHPSTEKGIKLAVLLLVSAYVAYEFSLPPEARSKWLALCFLPLIFIPLSFGGSRPPAEQVVAVEMWRDYAKARGYEVIEGRDVPFASMFRVIDKSGTRLVGQHKGVNFRITFSTSETPFRADGSMNTAARSSDSTTFSCEAPWLPDKAYIQLSGSYEGPAAEHQAVQAHGMTAFVSPPELIPVFRTRAGDAAMYAFKQLPTDRLIGMRRGIETGTFSLSESGFCTNPDSLDRAIDALTLFATLGQAEATSQRIARRAES